MRWWGWLDWFRTYPNPEVSTERKRSPCILDNAVSMDVPITSYIKKGMPLLVIEPTHFHVMQDKMVPVRVYARFEPGRSSLRNLPIGVYTVEPYMDLNEFIKETKSEENTETVSG